MKPESEPILRGVIESWSIHLTSDEILEKVLADPGPGVVVFGRVESPTEVLSRENWWERGCFQQVADPVYGPLTLQMPVWLMTGTPPRLRCPCRPVGHHKEHVHLKYLGFGRGRLQELQGRGIL